MDRPLDSPDPDSAVLPLLLLRESMLMGWIRREDLILGSLLIGAYLLWRLLS